MPSEPRKIVAFPHLPFDGGADFTGDFLEGEFPEARRIEAYFTPVGVKLTQV